LNITGRPEYRRGTRWRAQVCRALELLRRREAGQPLEREQAALAGELERALTPLMRRCLELYYAQGENQVSIARRLGGHRSNVCRCLERSEAHLERLLPEEATP
jgi:DNA-directed RNA polymerase specialized sigma subunit